MTTNTATASENVNQAIEHLESYCDGDDVLRTELSTVFVLLREAQDQLTYERAARDTLKWWADIIRTSEGEGLRNSLREGLVRIQNLDNLASPNSFPAGKVTIEEVDEESNSAEVRLTNVIMTLPVGTHFLYLTATEDAPREAQKSEH